MGNCSAGIMTAVGIPAAANVAQHHSSADATQHLVASGTGDDDGCLSEGYVSATAAAQDRSSDISARAQPVAESVQSSQSTHGVVCAMNVHPAAAEGKEAQRRLKENVFPHEQCNRSTSLAVRAYYRSREAQEKPASLKTWLPPPVIRRSMSSPGVMKEEA